MTILDMMLLSIPTKFEKNKKNKKIAKNVNTKSVCMKPQLNIQIFGLMIGNECLAIWLDMRS